MPVIAGRGSRLQAVTLVPKGASLPSLTARARKPSRLPNGAARHLRVAEACRTGGGKKLVAIPRAFSLCRTWPGDGREKHQRNEASAQESGRATSPRAERGWRQQKAGPENRRALTVQPVLGGPTKGDAEPEWANTTVS